MDNPLRLPASTHEIELLIQDRQFDTNGQLLFPDSVVNPSLIDGPPGNPGVHPLWIPEFFGDVVVNGQHGRSGRPIATRQAEAWKKRGPNRESRLIKIVAKSQLKQLDRVINDPGGAKRMKSRNKRCINVAIVGINRQSDFVGYEGEVEWRHSLRAEEPKIVANTPRTVKGRFTPVL